MLQAYEGRLKSPAASDEERFGGWQTLKWSRVMVKKKKDNSQPLSPNYLNLRARKLVIIQGSDP